MNRMNSARNFLFNDVREFISNLIEVPAEFVPRDFFYEKKEKKVKEENIQYLFEFIAKSKEKQSSDVDKYDDISKTYY